MARRLMTCWSASLRSSSVIRSRATRLSSLAFRARRARRRCRSWPVRPVSSSSCSWSSSVSETSDPWRTGDGGLPLPDRRCFRRACISVCFRRPPSSSGISPSSASGGDLRVDECGREVPAFIRLLRRRRCPLPPPAPADWPRGSISMSSETADGGSSLSRRVDEAEERVVVSRDRGPLTVGAGSDLDGAFWLAATSDADKAASAS